MISAQFTINGSNVPGLTQYVAEGSTVTVALVNSAGVNKIDWSFHGWSKNLDDGSISLPTFVSSGTPLGSTATFTMPTVTDGYGVALGITCLINNGLDSTGKESGDQVYISAVYAVNNNSTYPGFFGETLERNAVHGWEGSFNAAIGRKIDHGDLSGLLDDDHPQYLLVSGGRALTGNLDLGTNDLIDVGSITVYSSITATSMSDGLVGASGGLLSGAAKVVDADVSGTAAIAGSKISPDFGSGNIITTGTLTANIATGLLYSNSGLLSGNYMVVDSDVDSSAAIAGTKISPDFGSGNISTTGSLTAGGVISGLVRSASGVLSGAALVVDADVSGSAAIAGTKISPDFGAQNVTTTGTLAGSDLTAGSWTIPNTAANPFVGQLNVTTGDAQGLSIIAQSTTAGTGGTLTLTAGSGTASSDNGELHVETYIAVLDALVNGAKCSTLQPEPISTTDATATAIWSVYLYASKSYRAVGQILTNGFGAWDVSFTVDVDSSAVVTARDGPTVQAVGTAPTAALTVAIVGQTLTFTGTGIAATTMTWLSTVQMTEVGT